MQNIELEDLKSLTNSDLGEVYDLCLLYTSDAADD